MKKSFVLSIYFIIESQFISFANPMLVFYSIFNETILPSENSPYWLNVKTSDTDENWPDSTF